MAQKAPVDIQHSCEFFLCVTVLDTELADTCAALFYVLSGDPDALDIWYYMEGEEPLELPVLGLSWALDQPKAWAVCQIVFS